MRQSGTDPGGADAADDRLIGDDEAAAVIIGLQDREVRDRAAQWMEGPDAEPALRLWRALSRRCVGAYAEHATATLTLAGWVAWSTGDEPGARVALGIALRLDPRYTFAQLLHQACNEGLDPETLRRCLRAERDLRPVRNSRTASGSSGAGAGRPVVAKKPAKTAKRPVGKAVRKPVTKTATKRAPSPGARPGTTATGNTTAAARGRSTKRGGRRGTRSGR